MINVKLKPKSWRVSWSCVVGLGLMVSPLVTTLTLTALPALSQSVPTAVREAYTLLNQGLVDQAIAAFQRILRQNPQQLEAQLGLAIAYRRAGRDADALAAYQRVVQLDPNNRLALLTIGTLGGYRPEWQQQGIDALTRLLEIDPNDQEARAQRALLYGYQGKFADALADYDIVLRNNPSPEALLGAGEIYAYSGNYERSLELFTRYQTGGRTIRNGAAIAYALALRETGNPGQAVSVLEAELQRNGNQLNSLTIQLRSALASAYAANGQIEQALAAIAPLRGRQDSRMAQARALNDIARYSGNIAYAQEAIALYKEVLNSPYVNYSLAREIADVLSGYPSERAYALGIYQQLITQQPNNRAMQVQIAVLEREVGSITATQLQQRLQAILQPFPSQTSELQAISQALIQLDPPDPELQPIYTALINAGAQEGFLYFRLAQTYVEQGDFVTARNLLANYAATPEGMQDSYPALLLLAEMDRREGNLDAAAQRYQAILASNPTDTTIVNAALQGWVAILQSQGRYVEAIALYDQIIAQNPQDYAKQLGRTTLLYRANLISQADAEAALNYWLSTQPPTNTPPELYALVGALPANPQREMLYAALLQQSPDNIPVRLRLLQVVAMRSPELAEAQIAQLAALDPNNVGIYFAQGELAQDLGKLNQAVAAYEAILLRQPNNMDALVALGGVRFQQRQYSRAAAIYQDVLAAQPDNRIARDALIGLTAIDGRPMEAIRQLEQVQAQQAMQGIYDASVTQQIQRLEESFLQRRGFQPSWERY